MVQIEDGEESFTTAEANAIFQAVAQYKQDNGLTEVGGTVWEKTISEVARRKNDKEPLPISSEELASLFTPTPAWKQ